MTKSTTPRQMRRSGDIRKDLSINQLAWIGSIAIAFNEVEALIDFMLSMALRLKAVGPQITSRINGIDGKVEILKIAFGELSPPKDAIEALAATLGEGGFSKLKKYRDGLIHARMLDAPLGIGMTPAKRGKISTIIMSEQALEGIYNRLLLIRSELIEIANVLSHLLVIDAMAEMVRKTSAAFPRVSPVVQEMRRQQTEQEIPDYLSRHREHLRNRLSLPPLPEPPDESQEPPLMGRIPSDDASSSD